MSNAQSRRELHQNIVEKVLKLLALSEDQAGRPEGETAMKMATELMAKYRITEADLRKVELEIKNVDAAYSQIPEWQKRLWNELALFAGVYLVFCDTQKGRKSVLLLSGAPEDIAALEYMAEALTHQIDGPNGLADQWVNFRWLMTGKTATRTEKHDYKCGIVAGIAGRLGELTRRVLAHKGDQSTALTIVEAATKKRDAAERFVADTLGMKTSVVKTTRQVGEAFAEGVKDAAKVTLNPAIAGGAKPVAEIRA